MKIDKSRIQTIWIIVIIAIFSAWPRLMSVNDGLPYLHYHDEPLIIQGALNGLKNIADNNEDTNFLPLSAEVVYGGLMRYLCMTEDAIYYLYIKAIDPEVKSLADIKTNLDGVQPLTISHPGFYFWNRVLMALISSLGFVFLFLLARLRFGTINGLIAVLILAGIFGYYSWSYIVNSNIPLSTWTIGSLYFAIRFNHGKKHRNLIWSFVLAGLAMSTQLLGTAVILIPATAFILNFGLFRKITAPHTFLKTLSLVFIPLVIFLIFNPSVFLSTNHYLNSMNGFSELYFSGGPSVQKETFWEHLSYQISQLYNNLGALYFFLAVWGFIVAILWMRHWKKNISMSINSDILIITIFPIIYFLFITYNFRIAYHRSFLLFYPVLALFSAEGISRSLSYFSKVWVRIKPFRSWIMITVLAAVLFSNMDSYQWIFRNAEKVKNSSDTRSRAMELISDLSKNTKVFLGVEKGLKMSLYDLRKLNQDYGYFEIKDIDRAVSGFTHLLVPSYDFDSNGIRGLPEDSVLYIKQIIESRIFQNFRGTAIDYFHDLNHSDPIVSPTVKVIAGHKYPPPLMEEYKVP